MPIGNSLDRGEPSAVPESAQRNSPEMVIYQKSSMAWHPSSTAVQVLNLGIVPQIIFAQQCTSFSLLKHCYQNTQEALQGSSTRLEIRLTPRVGKSIHNFKRIKELQFLLGKYSYHEYTG